MLVMGDWIQSVLKGAFDGIIMRKWQAFYYRLAMIGK